MFVHPWLGIVGFVFRARSIILSMLLHHDTALGGPRESRNTYVAMTRYLVQVSSSPTSPENFVTKSD